VCESVCVVCPRWNLLTGEEMRNMVNQCFTEVIDVIQAHGGAVQVESS
jgi:hypothetical protein